jgi:hypothetical protein
MERKIYLDAKSKNATCNSQELIDRENRKITVYIFADANLDEMTYSNCIYRAFLRSYQINTPYADWLNLQDKSLVNISRFVDFIILKALWKCKNKLIREQSDKSNICVTKEIDNYFIKKD